MVAAALTVAPALSLNSSPSTPSTGKCDPVLIKMLCTTLGVHDPTCTVQGPVWALCTPGSLIVLLGPTLELGGPGTPQRAVFVRPTPFILRLPVLTCARDSDKDGWEMSTEHLGSWDATLQVCLACVLDDGADATRVLHHFAGTISSRHIPTSASATCARMLGHFDVLPDASALLGFVNDSLVSMYPPEPQNKVASMWLIRTTTRVVATTVIVALPLKTTMTVKQIMRRSSSASCSQWL